MTDDQIQFIIHNIIYITNRYTRVSSHLNNFKHITIL